MTHRALFVATSLVLGCNRPASEPAEQTPKSEAAAQPEVTPQPEAAPQPEVAPQPEATPETTPKPPSVAYPRLELGFGRALLTGPGVFSFGGGAEDEAWLAQQGAIEDLWLGHVICVRTASGVSCKRDKGDVRIELPSKAPVIDFDWSYLSICALTSDGAMACDVGSYAGTRPLYSLLDSGVIDIDVEQKFGCARLEDRSARCWMGTLEDEETWPPASESFANVLDIAVGTDYACILDEHGVPSCRDDTAWSPVVIGGTKQFAPIAGMPPLVDIDGGGRHVCGRTEAGEVWCWGSNEEGELGDGTTQSHHESKPVRVGSFDPLDDFVVDGSESCVRTGGQLQCWGWLADIVDPIPTEIPKIRASELEVGELTACARMGAGWSCWGGLSDLGGIAEVAKIVAVDYPEFNDGCRFEGRRLRCDDGEEVWLDLREVDDVLRSDLMCVLRKKRVECAIRFSGDDPPDLVVRVPESVSIHGSANYGCVLSKTGEVHCWTEADEAATRVDLPGKQVAVGVESMNDGGCALDEAGAVRCWSPDQPMVVAGVSDIVEMHGGRHFGCARDRAGAIACWGESLQADFHAPAITPDKPIVLNLPAPAVEFGIGNDYGCARLDDERVYCWGSESFGQRARVASEFVLRPKPLTIE